MPREKKCVRCAEMVKAEAQVCRFCGNEFPPETLQPRSRVGVAVGWTLAAILGLIVVGGLSTSGGSRDEKLGQPAGSRVATSSASEAPLAVGVGPAPAPRSNWIYSTEPDPLRGKVKTYARIVSDNQVAFNFPYSGGSSLSIVVRKDHHGTNVMFTIDKGQFVCPLENCRGAINVDGKSRPLSLTGAADGSHDVLFASSDLTTIRTLSGAKNIVVELPFYESGDRQFTFTSPVRLHWPPAKGDL